MAKQKKDTTEHVLKEPLEKTVEALEEHVKMLLLKVKYLDNEIEENESNRNVQHGNDKVNYTKVDIEPESLKELKIHRNKEQSSYYKCKDSDKQFD